MIVRLRDVPRWFLNLVIFVLVLMLLAVILARAAIGAPKANDAEECRIAADMALTAAAIQPELERSSAERVMRRIYVLREGEGDELLAAILTVVYRDRPDPEIFTGLLFGACIRGRGDMDGILGTDS